MKKFILFGAPLSLLQFDLAALLLRLSVGGMMLSHGLPKLLHFSSMAGSFPDPIGLGSMASLFLLISAEVFASLLIILGLFTRLACLPSAFSMFIAFFVIHAKDPFQVKELALIYLLLYLVLFFIGSGKFSMDYLLFRKKQN